MPDVSEPLSALAEQIREAAWALAVEVVDEGLVDDTVPSLQRLGQVGQLGDMPTFIVEVSERRAPRRSPSIPIFSRKRRRSNSARMRK